MNKEEILQKSRKENKNQDIYEHEVVRQAGTLSSVVMILLSAVFFAVQIFVGGGPNCGLWAVVFSASMTTFWVKYIRLRRRHELASAIAYTLLVLACSAFHIYNLIAASTIL